MSGLLSENIEEYIIEISKIITATNESRKV